MMNQKVTAPPRLLWVFSADEQVSGRIMHLGSIYGLHSGKAIANGASQCIYQRMDLHA